LSHAPPTTPITPLALAIPGVERHTRKSPSPTAL